MNLQAEPEADPEAEAERDPDTEADPEAAFSHSTRFPIYSLCAILSLEEV